MQPSASVALETTEKPQDFSTVLCNKDMYEHAQSLAHKLATSAAVPPHYRNNKFEILVALYKSSRMNIEPIEFMSNTYVVNGKISFSGKFAIALANARGPFDERIMFRSEGKGDELVVTAYAPIKGREVTASASLLMARAEGWSKRNQKYASMPEHMLSFRAANMLISRYCPEVLGGFAIGEEQSRTIEATAEPVTKNDEAILLGENDGIS